MVSGGEKVKLDGTEYKVEDAKGDLNNEAAIVLTANAEKSVTLKSLADKVVKGNVDKNAAASAIKLIDNDGDGKVDTAVYTPVEVGKVTSVSKSSVTVNNGINTVKFDDADVYEGVAKDDYIQFVDEANRSSNDKDEITKLDVTSAKVTGTRTGEIKVNDTWVKLAKNLSDTPETGNTYDMVIVGGVVLFAEETAASSKDVLYISGVKNFDNYAGEVYGTKEVKAYFVDGTTKTVDVSKLDGDKIVKTVDLSKGDYADEADVAANKLYTYSVLSDGTYDIAVLSNTNKAGYDSVTANTGSIYADQKIGGKAPMDDAVIFVQTSKETKVLSGKQIKNWGDSALTTASYVYALNEKNGINYVALAALVSNSNVSVPGATKDTVYGYLTADGYKGEKDGEDKATYEVWTSEGAKTLYADTASVVSGATAGAVISYNTNGDYIENIKVGKDIEKVFGSIAITGFDYTAEGELSFVSGYEKKFDGTTLIKKGANQLTLDEDCVFIGIDDKNTDGVEATMEQIQFANAGDKSTSEAETVLTNAYIVVGGDDDKVLAVIFDVENNELDNAKELIKATGEIKQ